MTSEDTVADIAGDPCAIIARSSCGTVTFFISYAFMAMGNNAAQHGFWLSVCLGLVGCMAIRQRRRPTRP
jgi:hypothetical protein